MYYFRILGVNKSPYIHPSVFLLDIIAYIMRINMVWMKFSVLEMSQEIVILCRFLCLFLLFFCASYDMFCVYLWLLPSAWSHQTYLLSVSCLCSCDWYNLYQDFHFSGIPLTLIGMPTINWFTRNTNVDVGNAIFPSIIFSVNADGIKDCLKYWCPYPMIIHVITQMVSSSYMSSCSALPITTCLNFYISF